MLARAHRAPALGMALLVLLTACGRAPAPAPLVVFNAAALGPPFNALFATLEADGSVPAVAQENSPSLEAVRKVVELGKVPDILATADLSLFDSLVVPQVAPWYLVFGTNALVLAYGPHSRFASEITDSTWADVLLRPGVRTGRSDPRSDPSGYRTLMALDLAERHYRRPGLAARLRAAMPDRYVRPAEAELSALVQTGEFDYVWTYRNLARAHGLRWVELPREVNLEDAALAAWYAQAQVELRARAGAPPLRIVGAPIAFGLTIPRAARSPAAALRFVERLLSAEGRRVMDSAGFTMLARPWTVGTGVPAPLRALVPAAGAP